MKVLKATQAWRLLNGVFCVHKPSGLPIETVKAKIRQNICEDLNALEVRSPAVYHRPVHKELADGNLYVIGYVKQMDYATHPAVIGDIYQATDVRLESIDNTQASTSGLCVLGVNDGCDLLSKIIKARYFKVYHLRGRLGRATVDHTESAKIQEKTSYHHITLYKLRKILSILLADFQRLSYESSGVGLDSQEAYELASTGMVRPAEDSSTIIYGAKCIQFSLPYITLEIQCINENEDFFRHFIHVLGLHLRSSACLSSLHRVRYGHWTLENHALLMKHWRLQNILNSIQNSQRVVSSPLLKPGRILGSDKLIDDKRHKYVDTIPSDFDVEHSANDEQLLLNEGVVEERLPMVSERFSEKN